MGVVRKPSKIEFVFGLFGSIAVSVLSCGGYVARPDPSLSAVRGVPLVFSAAPGIFPSDWIGAPFAASATPLDGDPSSTGCDERDASELERVRNVVARGLGKYPVSLLRPNLARVVIVGTLEFSRIHAAGTNSSDTVYLACAGAEDPFIEETLHHEFSSILLRIHPDAFDDRSWCALNPKDFAYGDSGVQAIIRGRDSLEYDEESNRLGFLHEYAQATLEDDFNSIVEKLFMNEPAFWEIVEKYPAISEKANLAIEFFQRLDPRFSREYFRGL